MHIKHQEHLTGVTGFFHLTRVNNSVYVFIGPLQLW